MPVLLATLRPVGVLGDQSDASYQSGSKLDGTLLVPAAAVALSHLAAAPYGIAFLAFYARVSWWPTGVGPIDPSITIRWSVGGGGEVLSDIYFVGAGVEQFAEIPTPQLPPAPVQVATQPNGTAWTLAAVNALGLRCGFFCGSQGSGESSVCAVSELRVDAWGNDPPPPPPGDLAPDVIRAAPLRSGNIRQPLSGGKVVAPLKSGDAAAALRSGNIRGRGGPA